MSYARSHLGPQLAVEPVVAHGHQVVPFWIETDGPVEGALAVGAPDGPQPPEHVRVVRYQVVGADTDQVTC